MFHLNVDKFELYVLKNLFVMPEASVSAVCQTSHFCWPHAAAATGAPRFQDEQEHAEEQGDDEKALEQSEEEAAALAAELEELKASVAKARSKHRALLSIKRLYEKRLPAARSSAQALKDAMGTLATPETSTGGGGEEASRPGPSTQATVADLVSEAAEVAAMCGRLSAAAGDQSGGNSGSSKRGRSRQSFGGVLSQYERDVKTMGGGVRGKGKK